MRCFDLACAPVLTRVAGFGKNVVPLFGLWIWSGFGEAAAQSVERFWEERSLNHLRAFGEGCFHRVIPGRCRVREFCFTSGCENREPG